MKKSSAYLIFMLGLLAFSSCRKEPAPSTDPDGSLAIRWDVSEVGGMKDTKALIEDEAGLIKACTPVEDGGEGKSIGVWADYSIEESYVSNDGQTVKKEAVYENVFDNAEIIYKDKPGGNPDSYWNSADGDVYWAVGGDYKFRAYYPQSMVNHIMESSDADVFVVDYNTSLLQEDMMVAYQTVDTQTADLSDPVKLYFSHALSAIRIRFQFIDGYIENDELTSCWLENTAKGGLTTIGMMIYGGSSPELISWSESFQPPVGQKIYYWKHPGLSFARTAVSNSIAEAYTAPATCTEGSKFAQNGGWLLIIPQESDGKTQICFTTKTGGDVIYRVNVPKKTGTKADGSKEGNNEELVHFAPSCRYTYTVNIGKTNLELMISLSKWNQLDSSYSITF